MSPSHFYVRYEAEKDPTIIISHHPYRKEGRGRQCAGRWRSASLLPACFISYYRYHYYCKYSTVFNRSGSSHSIYFNRRDYYPASYILLPFPPHNTAISRAIHPAYRIIATIEPHFSTAFFVCFVYHRKNRRISLSCNTEIFVAFLLRCSRSFFHVSFSLYLFFYALLLFGRFVLISMRSWSSCFLLCHVFPFISLFSSAALLFFTLIVFFDSFVIFFLLSSSLCCPFSASQWFSPRMSFLPLQVLFSSIVLLFFGFV